jgi:hypothetical protein
VAPIADSSATRARARCVKRVTTITLHAAAGEQRCEERVWRVHRRRSRRTASLCGRPQVPSHTAHVAFRARVQYAWHAYFGEELDVLYRETRRGEIVYICLMPDQTGGVIPEWMFDASRSGRSELGAACASIAALQDLRALLAAVTSDAEAVVQMEPLQQEVGDAQKQEDCGQQCATDGPTVDDSRRCAGRVKTKRARSAVSKVIVGRGKRSRERRP